MPESVQHKANSELYTIIKQAAAVEVSCGWELSISEWPHPDVSLGYATERCNSRVQGMLLQYAIFFCCCIGFLLADALNGEFHRYRCCPRAAA